MLCNCIQNRLHSPQAVQPQLSGLEPKGGLSEEKLSEVSKEQLESEGQEQGDRHRHLLMEVRGGTGGSVVQGTRGGNSARQGRAVRGPGSWRRRPGQTK